MMFKSVNLSTGTVNRAKSGGRARKRNKNGTNQLPVRVKVFAPACLGKDYRNFPL
jgi:hypothetical protein